MAPAEVGLPAQVDLPERLARIEARLDALEAAVAVEEETRDELAQVAAKVAWAVQHGRKRPW